MSDGYFKLQFIFTIEQVNKNSHVKQTLQDTLINSKPTGKVHILTYKHKLSTSKLYLYIQSTCTHTL